MNIFKIPNVAAAAFFTAFAAFAAIDAKNVADAKFEPMPSDLGAYMRANQKRWDFGFRPYDASASDLWTDPKVQRDAVGGKAADGVRPTAICFTMDERGFSALVFCGEPEMTNCFIRNADYPSPSLECYICPGDADVGGVRHHYHMYYDGYRLQEFPWLEADREFRPLLPYTELEEQVVANGFVMRLTYDWIGMFDYLPFVDADRKDNFWRFSAIRWAPGGGQTWGGKVHAPSSAGYIRFPEFTSEQKTAIMKRVLTAGWKAYRQMEHDYQYATGNGMPYVDINTNLYYREELAARPRSFVNYAEDPEFRPELARLGAERAALGPGLADFESMDDAEKIAFYKKASQLLFNFRYDVEEAYRKHQRAKLSEALAGKAAEKPYECKGDDVPSCRNTPRSAADLDKLEAEYAGLDAKIGEAKNADARARLVFRKEQLAFRLAKDDAPEKHLKAMEAAATSRDVDDCVMLDLLREYAQYRRDAWRRFSDTYDYERDALKALEGRPGATNPVVRAKYYTNALKLSDSRFASPWRSDLWNLCEQFSSEHFLSIVERGLADKIAMSGPTAQDFAGEMAERKWQALVAMARDADAETFLLGCLRDTERFNEKQSRARLVAFYREIAKRYETKPDKATLAKAMQYADEESTKSDIALEMEDWALAAKFAKTDLQQAEAAFQLGDFEKAANCYSNLTTRIRPAQMMRHAQSLYALGRYPEALGVMKAYQTKVQSVEKSKAAFYIRRLEELSGMK